MAERVGQVEETRCSPQATRGTHGEESRREVGPSSQPPPRPPQTPAGRETGSEAVRPRPGSTHLLMTHLLVVVDAQLDEQVDRRNVIVQLPRVHFRRGSGQSGAEHQRQVGRRHLVLRVVERHSVGEAQGREQALVDSIL